MTDPKEAAVQRLAEAIVAKWEERTHISGLPRYELGLALHAARIAIEHGVVPAIMARERQWAGLVDGIVPFTPDGAIPWDAVCPADAEGEK